MAGKGPFRGYRTYLQLIACQMCRNGAKKRRILKVVEDRGASKKCAEHYCGLSYFIFHSSLASITNSYRLAKLPFSRSRTAVHEASNLPIAPRSW
jgi:hypothetical protein